jgi:predicted ABC-type ATPase
MGAPRLRMFAGPNGSGKSTIKSVLPPELLGIYLNPDEIEKVVTEVGYLDFTTYEVESEESEILNFLSNSVLLKRARLNEQAVKLRFTNGKLYFQEVKVNAYFASVVADFLRQKLLGKRLSFSFETVMSSKDKIELLEKAQRAGYRTYLYFIATEDPAINIARVKSRVHLGGHDVPEEKIVSRYGRSLGLLMDAIHHTNRTYIFDNSRHGGEHLWVAEITDGIELEVKCDPMPAWFRSAVWDKIPG